jgi:hypothetical protein
MGSLLFARDVTPERVIEAFGMDPSAARMLSRDRASEALTFPVDGEDGYTANPWIRVGRLGDWSFRNQRDRAGPGELATLEMLTRALGIRLPEEVARGRC